MKTIDHVYILQKILNLVQSASGDVIMDDILKLTIMSNSMLL